MASSAQLDRIFAEGYPSCRRASDCLDAESAAHRGLRFAPFPWVAMLTHVEKEVLAHASISRVQWQAGNCSLVLVTYASSVAGVGGATSRSIALTLVDGTGGAAS